MVAENLLLRPIFCFQQDYAASQLLMKRESAVLNPASLLRSAASVLSCLLLASSVLCYGGESPSPNAVHSNSIETNKAKVAVPDTVAMEMEVAAFGNAITNHLQEAGRKAAAAENTFKRHEGVLLASTILVIVFLLVLRFGRRFMAYALNNEKQPWGCSTATAILETELANEEKAFADFAASFRIGPAARRSEATVSKEPAAQAASNVGREGGDASKNQAERALPVRSPREFLELAPNRITCCRSLLKDISRLTGELARKQIIIELSAQTQVMKENASHPDLAPIWQVMSSLEGLLKQLTEKPQNINPSTLRTIAGCVDLLDRLCSAGLKPDLLKTPPVRFLAVDDDPVSRHTISFALKRALNAPDLAEDGTAGLALAGDNSYDVIFLDVQMPGMDGFELCKKIRTTESNQSTPVVFVTCQSDFGSRAQSSLAGGCDLIGKPFLTFEITAKALMLALGNRLNRLKAAETAN
jgi:CheY-like chemotaxis protein